MQKVTIVPYVQTPEFPFGLKPGGEPAELMRLFDAAPDAEIRLLLLKRFGLVTARADNWDQSCADWIECRYLDLKTDNRLHLYPSSSYVLLSAYMEICKDLLRTERGSVELGRRGLCFAVNAYRGAPEVRYRYDYGMPSELQKKISTALHEHYGRDAFVGNAQLLQPFVREMIWAIATSVEASGGIGYSEAELQTTMRGVRLAIAVNDRALLEECGRLLERHVAKKIYPHPTFDPIFTSGRTEQFLRDALAHLEIRKIA